MYHIHPKYRTIVVISTLFYIFITISFMVSKKIVVIGAGFGGLSSAILLAKQGHQVTVVEKNDKVGGRANLLEANGYKRDM